MALDLATAIITVRVNRPQLATEITWARRAIIRGLAGLRINIGINPASIIAARRALSSGGGFGGGGFGGGGGTGGQRASRGSLGSQLLSGNVGGFAGGSMQIAAGIVGAQAALAALKFPVAAVHDAVDFERAMVRVKSISEATEEEFKLLNEAAIKIGRTTKFSPLEAAGAMGIMAQQGMGASDIIKNTPLILNFAAAGKVSPEEAAQVLLKISNAMKIPADKLEEVANILARAEFKSLANIHSLGEAFKYVGPLGELAGQSITEVAAALSLLEDSGFGGSIGGTGLKRIDSSLVDASKLAKLSKLIGAEFDFTNAATGKLRPLADIIDDINKALANTRGVDKLNIAMKVFGERAGPQFVALLEKGGDAIRARQDALGDLGIDINKLAAKDLATAGGAWDQLSSTISAFNIKVVTPFLPVLGRLVDGFKELLISLMDSDDFMNTVKTLASTIDSLVTQGAKFAEAFGEIRQVFDPLLFVLKATNTQLEIMKALIEWQTKHGPIGVALDGAKRINENREKGGGGPDIDGFVRFMLGDDRRMARGNADKMPGPIGGGMDDVWGQILPDKEVWGKVIPDLFGDAGREFQEMADAIEREKVAAAYRGEIDPLLSPDEEKKKDGKNKAFESKFIGIEDLHKTIQLGILNAKKAADEKAALLAAKETAVNTKDMADNLKNMVGRFA